MDDGAILTSVHGTRLTLGVHPDYSMLYGRLWVRHALSLSVVLGFSQISFAGGSGLNVAVVVNQNSAQST